MSSSQENENNSWTILNILLLTISFVFLLKKFLNSRKSPPGPLGFPLIGSLVTLNKENSLLKLTEYKQKYGSIFSVRVGNFDVVVLNDLKLIQEAMKREELSGRPDFEAWKSRNGGVKNRGILFTDANSTWSEQRRFALRNLRDFGFGKQDMEGLLIHEVRQLVDKFKSLTGSPINLKNNFNCSVFNSLWFILTGKRFELNDPKFHELMTTFSGHMEKLSLFSPANYYPWPAKYNLVRPGLWERAKKMSQNFRGFMENEIEEHLKNYNESVSRDFIDVYLHQHFKTADSQNSSFSGPEGIKNLVVGLQDLFQAGTETTSTTLLWGILFMTKDTQIQDKLHQEIDSVIGQNRDPTRDDKAKMPYLQAFTNEVHRKATVLPMSVFHSVVQDCNFAGYTLKKGSVVYPNFYDLNHDPEIWESPEEFRPERFLDADGKNLLPNKEAFIPFAVGRRACIGQTLAQDSLFLFFAGLLQNFRFQLDSSFFETPQRLLPKPNFIRSPDDFKVILTLRR